MATVNKDFKIKHGLIVEGSTATVNGYDVLTKKQDDQDYIVSLIGGTATSANTANTVVKRDASGDFAAQNVTVNTLYVGGSTNNGIDVIDGNTGIGSNNGIVLLASNDILLDAGQDIVLKPGSIGEVYLKSKDGNHRVPTRQYVDQEVSNAQTVGYQYADSVIAEEVIQRNYAIDSVVNAAISNEVTNRNSAISTAKGEAIYDASIYTDNQVIGAINTAAFDATIKTDEAKSYADGLVSTEITNRNSAIETAKGQAIYTAEGYTDSAISTEVIDRNLAIDSAINTEVTNRNSAIATANGQAIADAGAYTDAEIAALVDSAPELLNTLNELAAAIADNPNYATDAANAVAGRVAKAGDTMTGALTLSGAPTLDLHAANKGYVDTAATTAQNNAQNYSDTAAGNAYDNALADANSYTDTSISNLNLGSTYDAYGSAATAESNANSYTDGKTTTALTTAQGYATAAQVNAENYTDSSISTEVTNRNSAITTAIGTEVSNRNNAITTAIDALDTGDIEEGANLYFTDNRAKDAAGYLLENSIQSNIDISYNESTRQLTVTAEDGFAGHDTNDLSEGSTNLYFTNTRAQNAVDGTTRSFTSINLNTYRTEEATQQYVSAASTVTAHTFTGNKSAKYLVRTVGMDSGVLHSQISEVLVTVDGSNNVAVTEYGTIHTSTNPLSTVTADYAGGEYRLRVTTAIVNAEVIVAATTMSWAD